MDDKELKRRKRKRRKKKRKEKEFEEFLHRMTTNKSSKEGVGFLKRMVDQIPELNGVYEEQLKSDPIILPHIMMADITRFVIAQHQQELDSHTKSPVLESCLNFLEKGMAAGTETDAVQELISVSFLENLAQSDDLYDSIRSQLGPALRAELKFYEDEMGNPPQASHMPQSENVHLQNIIRDNFPGTK